MRLRITVRPTGDRTEDLRIAANVRRDLWAQSLVEIDTDNPLHGTHRDEQERAYFEFATDHRDAVDRILTEHGHARLVMVTPVDGPVGQGCQNCGNIAGPILPPVCPNCYFKDITRCAACDELVSRQLYTKISGDLFRCPKCRGRVRLHYNTPMFLPDGTYNQPLVVIEKP